MMEPGEPEVIMLTANPPRTVGVLIVDDHDGYRTIAAEVVTAAAGFSVIGAASDRAEALRWICDPTAHIDLVLMDVNLGRDDGVSLAQEIAAIPDSGDVVLVTTLAFHDLPRSAHECGARGYLPKAQLSPSALIAVCDGVYDWPDGNIAGRAGR